MTNKANRPLRIIVDMDGILADFMGGIWRTCQARYGVAGDTEKVTSFYHLSNGLEKPLPDGERLDDLFHQPGFFAALEPLSGAQEAMRALVDEGHEVVIASTPCTPHSAAEKIAWMEQHFPMIPRKNVFIGHLKHYIGGDVLIDDGLHNAMAFRKAQPPALVVTLAYPYNDPMNVALEAREKERWDIAYDLRAADYKAPAFAWGQIVGAIRNQGGYINDHLIIGR